MNNNIENEILEDFNKQFGVYTHFSGRADKEYIKQFLISALSRQRTAILQECLEKAPRDRTLKYCDLCDKKCKCVVFNQANAEWREIINNLLKE